jgi:hypothetical protein
MMWLSRIAACALLAAVLVGEEQHLVYRGEAGPGLGKKVVLLAGEEQSYHSEELVVQFGRILARHHGFTCTVLFTIDPKKGTINPGIKDNLPGLAALREADLMIIFIRWRRLPDEQMKEIVDYVESGRPVLGIRTATHAFEAKPGETYAKYGHGGIKEYPGGFGRQVLGETWVGHHGVHSKESTKGVIAPGAAEHPILRGIGADDLWAASDVYAVRKNRPNGPPLGTPLVLGLVLSGLKPTDPPVTDGRNDKPMWVAWTRSYASASGKEARVFTSTMGSGEDFLNEGLRRLLVNGAYWCAGLDERIPARSVVDLVGRYQPSSEYQRSPLVGRRPIELAGWE